MEPIYISLTSIYQNQRVLLKTLNSIINQTLLPNRIFVYLSKEPYLMDTGFRLGEITYEPLRAMLQKYSTIISVKFVPNEGSFRKLLPLLKEKWNEKCIIITIDDDTAYVPTFISDIVSDYYRHGCVINYRGFTPNITDIRELTYENRRPTIEHRHLYNFPTGKAGILYCPHFFHRTGDLIFHKDIYMKSCATSDDTLFMLVRVLNEIDCYLDEKPYMTADNTKSDVSLFCNYNSGPNNTIQIHNTILKIFP